MKFVVENVSKLSGRLGSLVQTDGASKFQTPLLLQTTKGGSIPHLSREVFKYITEKPHILEICLATTVHMEDALKEYKKSLASFIGYPEFVTFLMVKDPCENSPSGFHVKDAVPFFTRRGKRELTADNFMDIVEAFKPNIYHSLCDDDTSIDSSKKRVAKSVDRTENFFTICLDRHRKSEALKDSLFFAPIVGGYNKHARLQSVKFVSKHPEVGGFLIEGLHSHGESAVSVDRDAIKDIVSHCVQELDYNKPRMLLGAYHPLIVVDMIQLGIDIFDTSFAYIESSKCQALVFDMDLNASARSKKLSIDLSNESYAADLSPMLEDCTCLACRNHTKAYVHHLIKTKELLGPILLMIHNLHHYLKFFENIRDTILKDKMPDLVNLLKDCVSEEKVYETSGKSIANVSECVEPVSVVS